MATDFDRDDRLHGLLRDTLRGQSASGPCIDAATLAAWAEDGLTPEETAATDAHLATCARCRELAATLSTMAEAEDAPAAGVVPFTPRPNGRWKIIVGAMGAVAASVLIWVAVRDGSPSPDTTSAGNRAEQSVPREMGGNAPAPATAPVQSANALPRAEEKRARESAARPVEPRQTGAKPSQALLEPPARAAGPPPAAVPPPPPQPVQTAPPPATPAGAARSSTVTGLPQSTVNIDISGIKNQSDPMRSSETFFAVTTIAEFVVGADLQAAEGQQGQGFGAVADRSRAGGAGRGGGGGGGRGAGASAAAAGGVVQKTTDGFFSAVPVRWRLRGGSPAPPVSIALLERSKDAGVTWEPVSLPAQTTLLSGGSAPTNTVCWLAGRAGTVLLSTDGTTFRQVTKPVDADLVSVRATDARSATVRTADGRTFATIDGGATWTSR